MVLILKPELCFSFVDLLHFGSLLMKVKLLHNQFFRLVNFFPSKMKTRYTAGRKYPNVLSKLRVKVILRHETRIVRQILRKRVFFTADTLNFCLNLHRPEIYIVLIVCVGNSLETTTLTWAMSNIPTFVAERSLCYRSIQATFCTSV